MTVFHAEHSWCIFHAFDLIPIVFSAQLIQEEFLKTLLGRAVQTFLY